MKRELIHDPISGMYYRADSYDREILRSVNRDYFRYLKITPEDNVLDVGANIGAFSIRAAQLSKSVLAFEPDHKNFTLLAKNAKLLGSTDWSSNMAKRVVTVANFIGMKFALVAHTEPQVKLYKNTGTNFGSHSIIPMRGRRSVTVHASNFADMHKRYGPFSIIKVDIEGYEYELLMQDLPKCVKQIAIEFHLNRMEWRHTAAPHLINSLKDQGFRAVKLPKLTGKSWYSIGVFRRK